MHTSFNRISAAIITSAISLALQACGRAEKPSAPASPRGDVSWSDVERETLEHFQAVLRMNTTDPPGMERPAADYVVRVLSNEGIGVETFALEAHRPNVVARIKGNGSKRPLLLMGHMDVVNVDTTKWRFPPFSATRDSGYVYGRGAVDDKDNLTAGLMTMLLLKRQQVPLDRDVIFLAESGEEGSTRVGIQFMVNQHYDAIDAEYCLAEGGSGVRVGGQMRYATVSTTEKIPRGIILTSHGTAGHGSVPLLTNPIVHLTAAVAKFGDWRPPVELNTTTRSYFERLATISTPDKAANYRDVISGNQARVASADAWLLANEPVHASMLRTSISPTIINGGYRINVIPSEATATLDVRMLPGADTAAFLETVRGIVNDPAIDVKWAQRDVRPGTPAADLSSEGFKAVETAIANAYNVITLPTMLTGATDMAYLRAKGMQCYGVGPATDIEDGPRGFGAHGDQERILESELHRFVRFQFDVVKALAGSAPATSRTAPR